MNKGVLKICALPASRVDGEPHSKMLDCPSQKRDDMTGLRGFKEQLDCFRDFAFTVHLYEWQGFQVFLSLHVRLQTGSPFLSFGADIFYVALGRNSCGKKKRVRDFILMDRI